MCIYTTSNYKLHLQQHLHNYKPHLQQRFCSSSMAGWQGCIVAGQQDGDGGEQLRLDKRPSMQRDGVGKLGGWMDRGSPGREECVGEVSIKGP